MKQDFFDILVGREAVEQTLAVRLRQVLLRTAARPVRGVPGTAAAAVAIGKPDLRVEPAVGGVEVAATPAARGWTLVARPVVAGVILRIGEGGAVGLRPGEHFVARRK